MPPRASLASPPSLVLLLLLAPALAACASAPPAPAEPQLYRGGEASISRSADAAMVTIPAGRYIAGSTPEEREAAYLAYLETAGADTARDEGWFEREEERHSTELPAFRIDLMPVTNAAYAEFVVDTNVAAPAAAPPDDVERLAWRDGAPPPGREDHPAVLVSHAEAMAYCAWRGEAAGSPRRLPSAAEYEKAARGDQGIVYPWGNTFEAARLNSQVSGLADTIAAGSFPDAASPFGVLDAAGNVRQWTSTPWPHEPGAITVKGSAWDDWGGLGRGAAQQGRPAGARQPDLGFRCAADVAVDD